MSSLARRITTAPLIEDKRRLKGRKERKKKERERSETYQGDPSPTPNNFLISPLTGNKRAIEAFATFYILNPPP